MTSSSLSYEILLYLNSFYFGLFAVCEFGVGLFKVAYLPYPTSIYVTDLMLLIFLSCTESARIFLGRKGNLTERSFAIIVSVVLTVPSILGILYFLLWQTYVLRLEVVLCGIQLTLQALELGLALLCVFAFYKSQAY